MPPPLEQILIVEDDAAQRLGLQQLVRSWGYAVEVASDGEEALRKLPTVRPGIVLSDLVMPKMGVLDLLRAIQQQQPEIMTVLLTAQAPTITSQNRSTSRGCASCSTRPWNGAAPCARSRCSAASCANTARSAR